MQTVAESRIRRPMIPFRFDLELEGYTLVNYAIPPDRLRGWIPADTVLATRTVHGESVAWLSLFVGRNRLRGIAGLPAFPVQFTQLNYRTYLQTDHGHALYIFRTIVGSEVFSRGARLYPQLPAEGMPFRFALDWEGDHLRRVDAEVGQDGSELHLLVANSDAFPDTPGFPSPQDGVDFLGNVHDAFFPADESTLGLMYAPHPPLEPDGGRMLDARVPWLERHGLLTSDEALQPASIFLQGHAPFPTYL